MSAEPGERIPRFFVQVTEAYPELEHDLARVPARGRPDRVRVLATVGLAVMSGRMAAVSVPDAAPPAPPPAADDPHLARRLRLLEAVSHGN